MLKGFVAAFTIILGFGLLVGGVISFFAAAANAQIDYVLTFRNFYSWASLVAALFAAGVVANEGLNDDPEERGAYIACFIGALPGLYLLCKILFF